jgi:hypothetical protein
MSYIILRGCWCHIVQNVRAPTDNKTDDVKDSFYEDLERVFEKLPEYHMKSLLDLIANIVGEDFINQQLGMKVYTKLTMIVELE